MNLRAPTRPVLRYHGGKWMLAPWVIEHFPAHRVYVEPFGGGGSVLMRKPRAYAEVYGELDGEVCALFAVLRDPKLAADLERAIALTPYARAEHVLSYQPSPDPVEQARRTLFRSFAGFGSVGASGRRTGFRSNVTRAGTTPAADWLSFPKHVEAFTERLRGVVIENRPAAEVVAQYDGPETLHYVDPPYPMSTRTETAKWDTIYRHELSDDDHRALAATLRSLRGYVVVSGYPCALYDGELYPDWKRVERRHRADSAKASTEVLWLNPACSRAITGRLDFGAAS